MNEDILRSLRKRPSQAPNYGSASQGEQTHTHDQEPHEGARPLPQGRKGKVGRGNHRRRQRREHRYHH